MFLFSRKTKTPISTYTDSYRAPTSIKKVYNDPPLWAWEPNKFVTRVSRGWAGGQGQTNVYGHACLDDWQYLVIVTFVIICSFACVFFYSLA